MLETKQKSQADAEEEKRKMQQSALAKYRQAFTSDTEVRRCSDILDTCANVLPPLSDVHALVYPDTTTVMSIQSGASYAAPQQHSRVLC